MIFPISRNISFSLHQSPESPIHQRLPTFNSFQMLQSEPLTLGIWTWPVNFDLDPFWLRLLPLRFRAVLDVQVRVAVFMDVEIAQPSTKIAKFVIPATPLPSPSSSRRVAVSLRGTGYEFLLGRPSNPRQRSCDGLPIHHHQIVPSKHRLMLSNRCRTTT